jgi:hypothetical protein
MNSDLYVLVPSNGSEEPAHIKHVRCTTENLSGFIFYFLAVLSFSMTETNDHAFIC